MWGVQCELTFLGVRIVQEQQAHSSSGRSERSSLMMISIIQAICANRRRVFIRLLESARLAAQPALPPVLFEAPPPSPTLPKGDHCFVSVHSFHVPESVRGDVRYQRV